MRRSAPQKLGISATRKFGLDEPHQRNSRKRIASGIAVGFFRAAVARHGTYCSAPRRDLYDFNDALTHIYFPNRNAVVSLLCTTDERIDVEFGLCGSEGAVGLSGLLGARISALKNVVRVPGGGSRLTMTDARSEFRLGGRFQELLLQSTHALLIQIAQTALCNRLHSDEERLARWLLLSDDRVESGKLPLPRDLLAKLLGRTREGVRLTAAILERAGLVTYNEGEITIIDREQLESAACSCYWVVKRQTTRF